MKELDKPTHMSEHITLSAKVKDHNGVGVAIYQTGVTHPILFTSDVSAKSQKRIAKIIEACNNYEAVKKERDEAVRIAEQARQYVWARLTDRLIDSERELLDRLEQQINELLNK